MSSSNDVWFSPEQGRIEAKVGGTGLGGWEFTRILGGLGSIQAMLRAYPQLNREACQAALHYYADRPEEIDQQTRVDEVVGQVLERRHPHGGLIPPADLPEIQRLIEAEASADREGGEEPLVTHIERAEADIAAGQVVSHESVFAKYRGHLSHLAGRGVDEVVEELCGPGLPLGHVPGIPDTNQPPFDSTEMIRWDRDSDRGRDPVVGVRELARRYPGVPLRILVTRLRRHQATGLDRLTPAEIEAIPRDIRRERQKDIAASNVPDLSGEEWRCTRKREQGALDAEEFSRAASEDDQTIPGTIKRESQGGDQGDSSTRRGSG